MWHIRISFIHLLISFLSPVRSECLCGFKKTKWPHQLCTQARPPRKILPSLIWKEPFWERTPSPPTRARYVARYNFNITFFLQETKTQFTLHYRERKTHLACLIVLDMSLSCLSRLKATDALASQITPWISWALGTSPNQVKGQRDFKRRLWGFITPIFTHTAVFYSLYKMFCISEVEHGLKCRQVKNYFLGKCVVNVPTEVHFQPLNGRNSEQNVISATQSACLASKMQ